MSVFFLHKNGSVQVFWELTCKSWSQIPEVNNCLLKLQQHLKVLVQDLSLFNASCMQWRCEQSGKNFYFYVCLTSTGLCYFAMSINQNLPLKQMWVTQPSILAWEYKYQWGLTTPRLLSAHTGHSPILSGAERLLSTEVKGCKGWFFWQGTKCRCFRLCLYTDVTETTD